MGAAAAARPHGWLAIQSAQLFRDSTPQSSCITHLPINRWYVHSAKAISRVLRTTQSLSCNEGGGGDKDLMYTLKKGLNQFCSLQAASEIFPSCGSSTDGANSSILSLLLIQKRNSKVQYSVLILYNSHMKHLWNPLLEQSLSSNASV